MGHDFDTKIVVKVNAVERLRAELRHPAWQGELVAMGTNTDPYQRAEGRYRLTQGLVAVLAEAANPLSLLTKSPLIMRDLPLLVAAAARTEVRANFSVGTLDPEVWRLSEPGHPSGPPLGSGGAAQRSRGAVWRADGPGPARPPTGPEQLAEVVEGATPAPPRCRPSISTCAVRSTSTSCAGPGPSGRRWPSSGNGSTAGGPTCPALLQRELSRLVAELVADTRRRRSLSTTRAARPPAESRSWSAQASAARAAPTVGAAAPGGGGSGRRRSRLPLALPRAVQRRRRSNRRPWGEPDPSSRPSRWAARRSAQRRETVADQGRPPRRWTGSR